MSDPVLQARLASVDAIRSHQRDWLEATRARVQAGGHFAICNADDFEEIFTTLDIPSLVINYWNSIVTFSERKGPHYDGVLKQHGYLPHRFAHGFATALDPAHAPWGGLPKPTLIVGTTRDEAQMRVTELWAQALGCECLPLDFSWTSQYSREVPPRWWERVREDSESLLDLRRLELRVGQMRELIARLEALTGLRLEPARLVEVMSLLNQQMDCWAQARDIIAAARPLPVSLRDQMALYQITWQRGTQRNLELMQAYLDEVRALVARGAACYPQERFRIYLATSGNDPQYHRYLRERWGGAIVSNRYSAVAPLYARALDGDPLRALASRQLFLFDKEPHWEVFEAQRWGAHAVISVQNESTVPTHYDEVCEAAGLPHLALPGDEDSPDIRARIDAFVTARLS